jgi:hypothetical protein
MKLGLTGISLLDRFDYLKQVFVFHVFCSLIGNRLPWMGNNPYILMIMQNIIY